MCMYVKLTDLQILGCELHKNAFGASSRTRWMSYSAPQASKGAERGGRGMKELGIVWSGRKGREGKDVKGRGREG